MGGLVSGQDTGCRSPCSHCRLLLWARSRRQGGRGGSESCGLHIMKVLAMGFIPHLPVFNSVELSVLRGSEHWLWLRASLEGQVTAGGCHRRGYYLTKTRSSRASFPGWSGRASKPLIGTTHGLGQPPPLLLFARVPLPGTCWVVYVSLGELWYPP